MKTLIIIALLIVIGCQWSSYNELQDDYMHILQAIEEEILQMGIYETIETLKILENDTEQQNEGLLYEVNIEADVFKEVIRHLEAYAEMIEGVEELLTKIDDTLKYTAPYDEMTTEKFENLDKYYIEPLQKHIPEE